jgi:hypothetical protein
MGWLLPPQGGLEGPQGAGHVGLELPGPAFQFLLLASPHQEADSSQEEALSAPLEVVAEPHQVFQS